MRHHAFVGALAAATVAVLVLPAAAGATSTEAQLEEVRERRAAIEQRLATEAGDVEGIEDEIHAAEREVAALDEQDAALRAEIDTVAQRLDTRARLAFMYGDISSVGTLLAGRDLNEVTERAVLLQSLSLRDRAAAEDAAALRTALSANRERRQQRLAELDRLRVDLQAQVDLLAADLEQLAADEVRFADELRAEREAARRRAEEARRREREAEAGAAADSSSSGGGSTAPAPSSGGYACPVGDPVFFADTWGAPRSGGRSHQGVDMMAPHGTPVHAITAGRITRLTGNSLGGISIYMYGNDGNEYYYTHLQGYAAGTSSGQSVAAGTLIAYVGSTGNASSSAPHLHLEVHPGGGGAVNPYPYAAMACGR